MSGCGGLEKMLQRATRNHPPRAGHQDKADGQPFGDVVDGDGKYDGLNVLTNVTSASAPS
jgi:hypothetical protein